MAGPGKPVQNSVPGKVVRGTSKAVTGGAALLLAFLALMLFRLGGGGLSGTGENGDGAGGTNGSDGSAPEEKPALVTGVTAGNLRPGDSAVAVDQDSGLTPDERKALSGHVLTVLVDEHNYLIEIPSAEGKPGWLPCELRRVVQLAARASGDSNGMKVRILRRENSRASAEEQLKLDLGREGIHSDAVHMSESFVP